MRRWILWAGLTVFLLGAGITYLAGWRPNHLLALALVVSPEFAANWVMSWKTKMEGAMLEQSEKSNLATEVIKIELGGHKYNIPMRYTYGQAVEKRGWWPKAKPERVKVGALTISVLLPDLRPYYKEDDSSWKERGHGKRLEATITSFLGSPTWFESLSNNYFNRAKDSGAETSKTDVHGLIRFESEGLGPRYLPVSRDLELVITCSSRPSNIGPGSFFSPSCMVKSNYKEGIAIEYYYGRRYLELWYEIDSKLKMLFDEFESFAKLEAENR